MSCVLNSGIALACRDNTGGIARIWVMEFDSGLVMGLTGSNLDTINTFT